jgi:hypothetical protein
MELVAGMKTDLHDVERTVDGGKVATYRVYRRERPAGAWMEITTVFETQVALTDQPRGQEYEYRIVAANKAGDGEPSNTVMVVL